MNSDLEMSCASWPCEDEAQEYMVKHKIVELLDNLTAQVVFHRPGADLTYGKSRHDSKC